MATIETKRPVVDLEMNFDYNSVALIPSVEPQLNNLGKTLNGDELAGSVVMPGGHADPEGCDPFHHALESRRSVRGREQHSAGFWSQIGTRGRVVWFLSFGGGRFSMEETRGD